MFVLPKLPYDYAALEPYIDARTMEIHYTKHHQTYVDKLNDALTDFPEISKQPIEEVLANLDALPEDVRTKVRNHGGGHANHSLFWSVMAKDSEQINDALDKQLSNSFGSMDAFKQQFSDAAAGIFGSGWAWLVQSAVGLEIIVTPMQDSPISLGKVPILGLDVWEHAYYLKYQNKRPDYINAWWNIVNWAEVEKRLESASE